MVAIRKAVSPGLAADRAPVELDEFDHECMRELTACIFQRFDNDRDLIVLGRKYPKIVSAYIDDGFAEIEANDRIYMISISKEQ